MVGDGSDCGGQFDLFLGSSLPTVSQSSCLTINCQFDGAPLFSSLLSTHQTFNSKYRFWLLRGVTNRELPSGEMSIVRTRQDKSEPTGCLRHSAMSSHQWRHESRSFYF